MMKKNNKKVIILGTGSGYSKANKYKNSDYDIWGCATNLFHRNIVDMDLIFEIHAYNKELNNIYNKMREYPNNKYITSSNFEGIKSELYPIDKIREKYKEYFCSSFAYMIVLAIEKKYEVIKLLGIDYDITGTIREDLIERANLEYYIGLARGKGIIINTEDCPLLCRSMFLYGYERLSKHKKYLEDMRDNYKRNLEDKFLGKDYKIISEYMEEIERLNRIIERF